MRVLNRGKRGNHATAFLARFYRVRRVRVVTYTAETVKIRARRLTTATGR